MRYLFPLAVALTVAGVLVVLGRWVAWGLGQLVAQVGM
jgi:hypothetical protein